MNNDTYLNTHKGRQVQLNNKKTREPINNWYTFQSISFYNDTKSNKKQTRF